MAVENKVKIVDRDGKSGYERIGVITLITKYYIQVQFKEYRECYNKVDMLPNGPIKMFIRKNKKWIRVIWRVK